MTDGQVGSGISIDAIRSLCEVASPSYASKEFAIRHEHDCQVRATRRRRHVRCIRRDGRRRVRDDGAERAFGDRRIRSVRCQRGGQDPLTLPQVRGLMQEAKSQPLHCPAHFPAVCQGRCRRRRPQPCQVPSCPLSPVRPVRARGVRGRCQGRRPRRRGSRASRGRTPPTAHAKPTTSNFKHSWDPLSARQESGLGFCLALRSR